MTRDQVMQAFASWLDQASNPASLEKSLTIEKTGLVKSKLTGKIEEVEFTVQSTANVAQFRVQAPVGIITP